jgi:hypothetical protein
MQDHSIGSGPFPSICGEVSYVGWLIKEGRRKSTSLIVEFATKYYANRAIREGLVLSAIHHDCVLYDRSCRLK